MAMKVEVISSETIKPSSPTPPHLSNFKLSLCDQLSPPLYVPVILYYPFLPYPPHFSSSSDKILRLKSSLSLLLSRFYPFAGRIKDNLSIHCNDEGAYFLEAMVDRELSEVLSVPDLGALRMLLPIEMESTDASWVYPFLVQANIFACGGLALGICISHKITDGTTLSNFITSWANIAIDPDGFSEHPRLDASTIFPPSSHLLDLPVADLPKDKSTTRRYVFKSEKIAELVESLKSERVVQPTRVEAVSCLLWWCVTRASGRCSGTPTGRRSMLAHAVDLRPRMSTPITDNTVGNLATVFAVEMDKDTTGLRELTAKLRAEKDEFLENFVKTKMVSETAVAALMRTFEEQGALLHNEEVELYRCSSWLRLNMYEADFGWGKPIWLSLVNMPYKNTMILINRRGSDGVEAWLTLQEADMVALDHDEELLHFASLNSSVVW